MLVIMSVAVASAACSDGLKVVRHPIIGSQDPTGTTVPDSSVRITEIEDLAGRLARAIPTVQMGTLEGEPGTVLGRPIDVAETRDGRVLILDAMASEVRVFDARGKFLHTVLTRGQGPIEIVNALSIDVVNSRKEPGTPLREQLVVGTRTSVRVFSIIGDDATLEQSAYPPQIPLPSAACASSGAVHVRAALRTDSGVVAALDSSGRVTRRFGAGYSSGGPLAREELSVGPLACLPNGGAAIAFTYLPRVAAFDADGREMWSVNLPNFKGLPFEEELRGRKSIKFTAKFGGEGDMVQSLAFVPPNGLLIQVARLSASTPSAPKVQHILRVRTYLLSTASGRGGYIGDKMQAVIGASEMHLWTVEEGKQGFPVVVGYRY